MASSKVPGEVRDFVARYLPSVKHLEVFMLLRRTPSRFWSGHEIAAELRIPDLSAGAVLERLAADNFLDLKICNDLLYRFNPATPALEAAANRSAEFYLAERVSVIELVMTGKLEREKRG